jgi:hypothetical protein
VQFTKLPYCPGVARAPASRTREDFCGSLFIDAHLCRLVTNLMNSSIGDITVFNAAAGRKAGNQLHNGSGGGSKLTIIRSRRGF